MWFEKYIARDTLLTISSRFVNLLGGFGLLTLTTHFFGTGGRGEIALVVTNVGIITTIANVFCGSTLTFHTPLLRKELLLGTGFLWGVLISFAGGTAFAAAFGFNYTVPLLFLSLLISLGAVFNSFFLGKQKIGFYNLLTLLPPVLTLLALLFFHFMIPGNSVNTYFFASYAGYGLVLLTGLLLLFRTETVGKLWINLKEIKPIFVYGINNEFNYLIQLVNYRLSYYIIALYIGMSDLGVFSVVVAVSEAVWIISKSISSIHYSNVVNNLDNLKSQKQTKDLARQSFFISIAFLIVVALIPESLYLLIFGKGFGSVGNLVLYLFPGIIAIAVSNIHGNYFAGIGKLNILRNKSLLGLAASVIFLFLLVPRYSLKGACIAMDISYLTSSVYLWIMFRKELLSSVTQEA